MPFIRKTILDGAESDSHGDDFIGWFLQQIQDLGDSGFAAAAASGSSASTDETADDPSDVASELNATEPLESTPDGDPADSIPALAGDTQPGTNADVASLSSPEDVHDAFVNAFEDNEVVQGLLEFFSEVLGWFDDLLEDIGVDDHGVVDGWIDAINDLIDDLDGNGLQSGAAATAAADESADQQETSPLSLMFDDIAGARHAGDGDWLIS